MTWKREGRPRGSRRPLTVLRRLLLCVDARHVAETATRGRLLRWSFGRFVQRLPRAVGRVPGASVAQVENRVGPSEMNYDDGFHVTVDVASGACCALPDARALARELERLGYVVKWWEELVREA